MAVVDEEARLRSPSLDLAARTLKEHVPHVLDDLIISDQVYVARDSSFDDAVGVPEVSLGDANFSVRSAMSRLDLVLSDPDAERTLVNALAAPAVASDPTRKERLTAALRTDLLADDGGSYGRYELLREMQPVLMRASVDHPLAVFYLGSPADAVARDHRARGFRDVSRKSVVAARRASMHAGAA